jgi:hypothetical protein
MIEKNAAQTSLFCSASITRSIDSRSRKKTRSGVAAAFAVLYQDPPDDPIVLADELLLEPVGGGEQGVLGDARLELERCQCDVHVGLSPFVV